MQKKKTPSPKIQPQSFCFS